jgi:hypothetical protein
MTIVELQAISGRQALLLTSDKKALSLAARNSLLTDEPAMSLSPFHAETEWSG